MKGDVAVPATDQHLIDQNRSQESIHVRKNTQLSNLICEHQVSVTNGNVSVSNQRKIASYKHVEGNLMEHIKISKNLD